MSGHSRRMLEAAALVDTLGGETTVTVDLGDTGYRLRQGHRLRLSIASSDFPRFMLHPGSDVDPWLAVTAVRNEQRVVCGGDGAPRLELTTLPVERH